MPRSMSISAKQTLTASEIKLLRLLHQDIVGPLQIVFLLGYPIGVEGHAVEGVKGDQVMAGAVVGGPPRGRSWT